MKNSLVAILGALPVLAAAAGLFSDDRPFAEEPVQPPAPPAESALFRLPLGAAATARVFVDTASLSVGTDGVVHFTTVVIGPGGARNVNFEGMHCSHKERKVYAFGRSDGSWAPNQNAKWVAIEPGTPNDPYLTIFNDYFCPDGIPIRNPAEGLRMLREGGKKRPCDTLCVSQSMVPSRTLREGGKKRPCDGCWG